VLGIGYWGKRQQVRLKGWRYQNEVATEIQPDEQGRLWSEELQSFVTKNGSYVRLYDAFGNLHSDEVSGKVNQASLEARAEERNLLLAKLRAKALTRKI
jgi:hypothetical protein